MSRGALQDRWAPVRPEIHRQFRSRAWIGRPLPCGRPCGIVAAANRRNVRANRYASDRGFGGSMEPRPTLSANRRKQRAGAPPARYTGSAPAAPSAMCRRPKYSSTNLVGYRGRSPWRDVGCRITRGALDMEPFWAGLLGSYLFWRNWYVGLPATQGEPPFTYAPKWGAEVPWRIRPFRQSGIDRYLNRSDAVAPKAQLAPLPGRVGPRRL